jgi:hypothetical protein
MGFNDAMNVFVDQIHIKEYPKFTQFIDYVAILG